MPDMPVEEAREALPLGRFKIFYFESARPVFTFLHKVFTVLIGP